MYENRITNRWNLREQQQKGRRRRTVKTASGGRSKLLGRYKEFGSRANGGNAGQVTILAKSRSAKGGSAVHGTLIMNPPWTTVEIPAAGQLG